MNRPGFWPRQAFGQAFCAPYPLASTELALVPAVLLLYLLLPNSLSILPAAASGGAATTVLAAIVANAFANLMLCAIIAFTTQACAACAKARRF